ncbi:transglutaminase family protein [Novosphingobium sp. UBA1939]|uniref:transglutaminase family protein n=1 Tax=Novosphingobium sp. UBA1939 TaxID=1946982 RepID=UPI0025E18A79|nr:transglutaminase family protein [Novosphingobium sp. UBA1939]
MRIAIDHTTHYRFSEPAAHGLQRLRLTPKATSGQTIQSWDMELAGAVLEAEYDDHNCNHVSLIAFTPGATDVTIRCRGVVDTADNAGIVGKHSGHLPLWHFAEPTELTRAGPRVRALLAALGQAQTQTQGQSQGQSQSQSQSQGTRLGDDRLAVLHDLSALVAERVAYATGHTDAATPAEAVLTAGHGVCQDHAHVFIAAARALGIPARYVSGYLLMDDRVDQDAGHAWAEAFVANLGWVGFDISNRICPDVRYVRVATGADYRDAAPITGIRYGDLDETMHVKLAVEQQRVEQ